MDDIGFVRAKKSTKRPQGPQIREQVDLAVEVNIHPMNLRVEIPVDRHILTDNGYLKVIG